MATRWATCRATSKQQSSSPSAGGWAMSSVPSSSFSKTNGKETSEP